MQQYIYPLGPTLTRQKQKPIYMALGRLSSTPSRDRGYMHRTHAWDVQGWFIYGGLEFSLKWERVLEFRI